MRSWRADQRVSGLRRCGPWGRLARSVTLAADSASPPGPSVVTVDTLINEAYPDRHGCRASHAGSPVAGPASRRPSSGASHGSGGEGGAIHDRAQPLRVKLTWDGAIAAVTLTGE